MRAPDQILLLIDLLRQKHEHPNRSVALAVLAAVADSPTAVFDLCAVVDTAVTHLQDELARTRGVPEFLDQLENLIRFRDVAAAYDPLTATDPRATTLKETP